MGRRRSSLLPTVDESSDDAVITATVPEVSSMILSPLRKAHPSGFHPMPPSSSRPEPMGAIPGVAMSNGFRRVHTPLPPSLAKQLGGSGSSRGGWWTQRQSMGLQSFGRQIGGPLADFPAASSSDLRGDAGIERTHRSGSLASAYPSTGAALTERRGIGGREMAAELGNPRGALGGGLGGSGRARHSFSGSLSGPMSFGSRSSYPTAPSPGGHGSIGSPRGGADSYQMGVLSEVSANDYVDEAATPSSDAFEFGGAAKRDAVFGRRAGGKPRQA